MTITPDAAPIGTIVALMPNGLHRDRPEHPLLFTAASQQDARYLSCVLFDSRRDRPLLVLTPPTGDRPPADPLVLAAELWSVCDVVAITDPDTADAFADLVPSWLVIPDGACRLYLPGADLADDRQHHPLIEPESPKPASYLKKIRSIVTRRAREHRRTDPHQKLTDAEAAHTRTLRELDRVRQELARVRDTQPAAPPRQPASTDLDPDAAFRVELDQVWRRTVPPYDRVTWRLRPYTIGPEFLDSITELDGVDRDRILRACVDAVTGRYPIIRSRDAKRLKRTRSTHSRGSDHTVTRASDDARAWRMAIGMGGSAPRLMWWETPDGPELSRVAVHNDFRIA